MPVDPSPTSRPQLPNSTGTSFPQPTIRASATASHTRTLIPSAGDESEPERIEFEPGATQWNTQIERAPGAPNMFVLRALRGQTMQISALPVYTARLKIFGADGAEIAGYTPYITSFWRGQLPRSQDYFIELDLESYFACTSCAALTLTVAIAPSGQASQSFDYVDGARRFELTYSDYFVVDDNPPPYYRDKSVFSLLLIESEYYDQTNLNEAYFIITASKEPQEIANCTLTGPPIQGKGEVRVNNVDYQWMDQINGGAGNIWQEISYMTIYGETCFHVIFFLHSHHAENYDPPVSDFDADGVIAKLTEVFDSLVFLEG